jgi:hypothetical protein
MVKEKHIVKYECPYCGKEYDGYDDAYECARECCEPDEPIEHNAIDTYTCEYCNNEYNNFKEAQECEEKHIEKEDKYYNEYSRIESFKNLKEAANFKGQTKLIRCKNE